MAYIVAFSWPCLGRAWARVPACLRRDQQQVHKQLNDNNTADPPRKPGKDFAQDRQRRRQGNRGGHFSAQVVCQTARQPGKCAVRGSHASPEPADPPGPGRPALASNATP